MARGVVLRIHGRCLVGVFQWIVLTSHVLNRNIHGESVPLRVVTPGNYDGEVAVPIGLVCVTHSCSDVGDVDTGTHHLGDAVPAEGVPLEGVVVCRVLVLYIYLVCSFVVGFIGFVDAIESVDIHREVVDHVGKVVVREVVWYVHPAHIKTFNLARVSDIAEPDIHGSVLDTYLEGEVDRGVTQVLDVDPDGGRFVHEQALLVMAVLVLPLRFRTVLPEEAYSINR